MNGEGGGKQFSVHYLYVVVFTTVTVMLWIGFEVFRSLTAPAKVAQVTPEQLEPLQAEIDTATITQLKNRLRIEQQSLDGLEVSNVTIAPVTGATESATIEIPTQSEEGTASGGI